MLEALETTVAPDLIQEGSDSRILQLQQFQKKEKPIGWEVKGDELRFVKIEDLLAGDLDLFDQIENQEVNAGNVVALENAIKENFSGVSQKDDLSRFHFQAFLRNLLMSKWYVSIGDRKNRTTH